MLADAVGEEGHVDAVDPGSPDYGKFPMESLIILFDFPNQSNTASEKERNSQKTKKKKFKKIGSVDCISTSSKADISSHPSQDPP